MMGKQSGLGRGLGSLIPARPISALQDSHMAHPAESGMYIQQIPVDRVAPNPHQPRTHFDHGQLEDLISSIQIHGVMQPIVVTVTDSGYELIAGERRLRASKIAGLETIPAIVRTATEQQKLELALIENIQRAELNAIEEARAYVRLQNEFNLTQDEVGRRVGKSRPQVANIIRLLNLPEAIQNALAEGKINQSNARTLLSLSSDAERMELFSRMLEGNFTVRQTEARIPRAFGARTRKAFDPNIANIEDALRKSLGVKVVVKRESNGEGEIRITFLNEEDLNGLLGKLTGNEGVGNM